MEIRAVSNQKRCFSKTKLYATTLGLGFPFELKSLSSLNLRFKLFELECVCLYILSRLTDFVTLDRVAFKKELRVYGLMLQFQQTAHCLQVRDKKWGARGPGKPAIYVKYGLFIYLFILYISLKITYCYHCSE